MLDIVLHLCCIRC
jgi:hypothetical protein